MPRPTSTADETRCSQAPQPDRAALSRVGSGGAESPVFEWICEELLNDASLPALTPTPQARRLAMRGTVRIALQKSGLSPRTVSPLEMEAVLREVMATELRSRGIGGAADLCDRLAYRLARSTGSPRHERPLAADSPK